MSTREILIFTAGFVLGLIVSYWIYLRAIKARNQWYPYMMP